MSFLIALIVSIIGTLPMFLKKKVAAGGITLVISTLLYWWIIWGALPSSVWPLFGWYGAMVLLLWILSAIVCAIDGYDMDLNWTSVPPILGIVLYVVFFVATSGIFRSSDYAKMIGTVDDRVWTQDVQPKDPRHIRLVPQELAEWLADKQIGDAPGALGSQFHVSKSHMTLQMVRGELWYVAPLEFNGFTVWTDADVSPGYVMVLAEDPYQPVQLKLDHKYEYMTEACFSKNLQRHLWNNGYRSQGLTDYSFEVNDSGVAKWVVSVFEPTIGFSGCRIKGVATVDPTTGEIVFYKLGEVPSWIDRVIPKRFIESYIDWWGEYQNGWWNSVWGKKDLIEGENATINYGSDGEPYWVTTLTSTSSTDESMVGLVYTDSRTGRSIRYKATGGTEAGVLQAVDNKVVYRKFHGSGPVLYNIHGTMASIVPLLGENHTYQGVAIVQVDNMSVVAIGTDQYVALRDYQKQLALSGQQITAELAYQSESIRGMVARFSFEVKGDETNYYLLLSGGKQVFTAVSELSPKLPLTAAGDQVVIEYIGSDESVVSMTAFDNTSLPLLVSRNQAELNDRVSERKHGEQQTRELESARGNVENMSDEEIQELLKLKAKKEGK
ncbi:MAG: hypothetical protein V1668_01595 [Patescibacteria group bacterium]